MRQQFEREKEQMIVSSCYGQLSYAPCHISHHYTISLKATHENQLSLERKQSERALQSMVTKHSKEVDAIKSELKITVSNKDKEIKVTSLPELPIHSCHPL